MKIRTGYVFTFDYFRVLWQLELQTETALSHMEAENFSLDHKPFFDKFHTITCVVSIILLILDLAEGKEEPREKINPGF